MRLAFQFLTIISIRISKPIADRDLAASMRWYPVVGAFIGGLSAAFYLLSLQFFSPGAASVAGVVGLIVFSGALHIDGFADTCDGFYGQRDRADILRIMKDSHVGSMAVVGVFGLLALKIAFLSGLEPRHGMLALVAAATLGRWSMVWHAAASTYARAEGGTASAYIGHVDRQTFWIATLSCAGVLFAALQVRGLLVMLIAVLGTWLFRRGVEGRLGGMTGDTLGASCECVELLTLAALCFHGGWF